ncbi:hypothetical protein HDV00_003346 [Rhizophlyctis rosea]|nr:hypothetical protein HDV00_003346 [Rhizophlyctis rosea]
MSPPEVQMTDTAWALQSRIASRERAIQHMGLLAATSFPPSIPHPPLLGGADRSSPGLHIATAINSITAPTLGTLRAKAVDHFNNSPITTLQILLGSSLHIGNFLGLTPYRSLLFHPRLALPPHNQFYRPLTSLLVLGPSIIAVGQSAVALTYWQSPLERYFDGDGDTIRDGVTIHEGANRRKPSGARKNIFEWLITDNAFIRAQLLSAAVIIALEFALYRDPSPSKLPLSIPFPGSSTSAVVAPAAASLLIYPYSLFPTLEYSMRWIWAITDQEREVVLFGILPVRPVYLPLALCAVGGFKGWKSMLKGLVAALVVGKVMDLRRAGGENAVDWLWKTAVGWGAWGRSLVDSSAGGAASGPATSKPAFAVGESFSESIAALSAFLPTNYASVSSSSSSSSASPTFGGPYGGKTREQVSPSYSQTSAYQSSVEKGKRSRDRC